LRSFILLIAGATALYLGGMFLNDAVDVPFDRQFRPERPIPSGCISRRAVLVWSAGWLAAGWLALLPLGADTARFSAALAAAIVFYDLVHKRTQLAPFLMGACRFLLYLTAAASAKRGQIDIVLLPALGMAAYVSGLSLFARSEASMNRAFTDSTLPPRKTESLSSRATPDPASGPAPTPSRRSSKLGYWAVAVLAIALLTVPLALSFARSRLNSERLAVFGGTCLWILWCLRHGFSPARFSRSVPGLLAGIVLVDWLYAPVMLPLQPALFGALFCLALLLQRIVPAT
jgi:UbiA prenyltransferase family protein